MYNASTEVKPIIIGTLQKSPSMKASCIGFVTYAPGIDGSSTVGNHGVPPLELNLKQTDNQ